MVISNSSTILIHIFKCFLLEVFFPFSVFFNYLKIGKTFLRGEFRGGGKKSLPQKTAFSLEQNFGKISGWIAYLVTKNPNQQAENEIAAGISMNLPWPIR